MPWQTTQASLLLRLRDSADDASWREFDHRYGELVLRYCLRRGLQLADAEDVRQEVFVSLARRLPGFTYSPARGRFRSYLGRVVHNAISRHATRPFLRREMLCREQEALPEPETPARVDPRWEREWMDHHLRRALRTVRNTFDPRSVRAFEGFLAGDPAAAVASRTGLSVAAAHKVKQRIRDRIQELVEAQIREEGDLS